MDGIPAIPHQRNHPEAARRHSAAAPDATTGTRTANPPGPAATPPGASDSTPDAAPGTTPATTPDTPAATSTETPTAASTGATAPADGATAPADGSDGVPAADPGGALPGVPSPGRTGGGAGDDPQPYGRPGGTRFAVLGPIRAWRGGEALPSGTPQQRALLAALLLRGGRTATAPELIDAIWGEDPPQQALATIRTYASRLRKILAPGMLVTESGGYAIHTPAGTLDLGIARGIAADADQARSAGDRTLARTLLDRALDLWDGEPLAGVPGPHAETERTRLAEWRLQLLETRLDLDLEVGHHAEAVSELTALTAAHPLRERLRELLMLALYRSGRQAEALAVYADTRRLLADELGVDPRPELSALQQRILRADTELACAEDPVPASAPALVRPAQLPATVADFTGRTTFVNELGEILAGVGGQVMAVSALAGIGGVGKTTLAVHVAHAARPHFPDGQLYVDLQGTEPRPAEPVAVLGAFLRALGTPTRPFRTPPPSGPRSTGPRSTAAASWSCSTTPATPPRSARCCPAPRVAPPSSPAGSAWRASPGPISSTST